MSSLAPFRRSEAPEKLRRQVDGLALNPEAGRRFKAAATRRHDRLLDVWSTPRVSERPDALKVVGVQEPQTQSV